MSFIEVLTDSWLPAGFDMQKAPNETDEDLRHRHVHNAVP